METSPAKTDRRWSRFGLRSLLILFTVFAVGFASVSRKAQHQQQAIAAATMSGGNVWYEHQQTPDPKVPGSNFYHDAPTPGPQWLRNLLGDDYFCTANCFSLALCQLKPEDLEKIARLPRVTTVNLLSAKIVDPVTKQSRPIEDSDLKFCADLLRLRNLVLSYSQVTDAGLAQVEHLDGLEELYLRSSRITDAGIDSIRKLNRLETLDIRHTAISSEGHARLKSEFPNAIIQW